MHCAKIELPERYAACLHSRSSIAVREPNEVPKRRLVRINVAYVTERGLFKGAGVRPLAGLCLVSSPPDACPWRAGRRGYRSTQVLRFRIAATDRATRWSLKTGMT